MEGRADACGVVDLKKCHFITLDERLDDQVAAVRRLALDRVHGDCLDISVS